MKERFFVVIALIALLHQNCHAQNGKVNTFANCVSPLRAYQPANPTYNTIIGQSLITRGRPVSIVIAKNTQQVGSIVKCAKQAKLSVCPRSGGHALDGRSLCNNAVMIDLNEIRDITVNGEFATIGSGATLGETYWKLHSHGRWFSGGTCPNVGVGGYLLGGGHGPYEGRLGLGCDSLEEVTVVTRNGYTIKASRSLRQGLFWAMCGAGGSQFGIITYFKIRTAPAGFFDRAVVFDFSWPVKNAGEFLAKYVNYEPLDGNTWVRTIVGKGGDTIVAKGACFDVANTEQCLARLRKEAFFNVAGRKQNVVLKARTALHVAGYFGPGGNRFPPNLWRAFHNQRFTDGGKGNENSDMSAYLEFKGKMPNAQFWQSYINFCINAPGVSSLRRMYCQTNLFKGATKKRIYNAFPFRASTVQIHVTIGPSTDQHRKIANDWIRSHFLKYTSGVYVNYQDPFLETNYARMYWGKSLNHLKGIKVKYDPQGFFANPQPIPVV